MLERFERNIPALTEKECDLLREKRVAVIGCGGLGGYLVELMARLGVGHIRLVDGDFFTLSNLNRQLLSTPAKLGVSKAEAAAERVKELDGDIHAEAFPIFLDESNAFEIVSGCDAVLDGLDNIDSRRILAAACEKAGVPLVHGAIAGWTAQAAVSMPGDNLVSLLYPEGTLIKDKSALSFTPAFCAAVQASLCARLLVGREVCPGRLYYFDLLDMELESVDMI